MAMTQEEINELHGIMENFFRERNRSLVDVRAFLNVVFVRTMAMHGCSEDFFEKILDRMRVQFKRLKKIENPDS